MSTPRGEDRGSDDDTGREPEPTTSEPTTSEPATSGHSTADTQVERNREDESPG